MDYAAEQEMEIEALQAILMDDLQEVDTPQIPPAWSGLAGKCWRVEVVPMEDGEPVVAAGDEPMRLELVFAHTACYPDEPPLYKARSLRGLSDDALRELEGALGGVVAESLGMAMVYTLVTAAQEWLRDKMSAGGEERVAPEEARRRAEEAEERRLEELRKYGTPVTPGHFAAWLAKFQAQAELQRAKLGDSGMVDKKGRLTGKQWFLQQEKAGVQVSEEPDAESERLFAEEQAAWEAQREIAGGGDEDEDNSDFDPDDEGDDDDEMLDEFLADKS